MQLVALTLEILGFGLRPAGSKDAAGTRGHGFLPLGNLHRMDVEILGDLLDGLDALERLKSHAGLEFGFVSSSFCFHFVWFSLDSRPAPDHHNPSLTPGPNFGVRLTAKISPSRKGLGQTTKNTAELLESKDNETVLKDLGMAKMLRCRIRYFTDGAVIGSKEFVNEAFASARERFGPKRKDGARKLRGGGAPANGALWSLRDLRKGIA